jgi:transposase
MVMRRGFRRIRSKTARAMCKTCGRCGHIHEKLGGNKRFKCPACGLEIDRDANGARNILLRYLALHVL